MINLEKLDEELGQDKLTDPSDVASRQEAAFRFHALNSAADACRPQFHPEFDGEHCLDCDGDIPYERLKMHKIRCVYCQSALEKKR